MEALEFKKQALALAIHFLNEEDAYHDWRDSIKDLLNQLDNRYIAGYIQASLENCRDTHEEIELVSDFDGYPDSFWELR